MQQPTRPPVGGHGLRRQPTSGAGRARDAPKTSAGFQHLPRQLTPFVGREKELAALGQLLADPTCRLLTLVGPGGIGKTRLALEAAAGARQQFSDGVYFVTLQAVASPDFQVSVIADALDVTLSGHHDPQTQLRNYLSDKALLLVLDNFEQLSLSSSFPPLSGKEERDSRVGINGGDAASTMLLTDILRAAPALKLLVTSREALNLHEEWLFPVEGLAIPADTHSVGWRDADAVQLFAQCARRVRRDFSLETEAEAVVHVCRLVEGMPLAIELAASWLKTLTCAEIGLRYRAAWTFWRPRCATYLNAIAVCVPYSIRPGAGSRCKNRMLLCVCRSFEVDSAARRPSRQAERHCRF
jgi:hypothetical protein